MPARRHSTLEQRRAEHLERLEEWQAMTYEAQLAELDSLGLRALRQRARIAKRMAAYNAGKQHPYAGVAA